MTCSLSRPHRFALRTICIIEWACEILGVQSCMQTIPLAWRVSLYTVSAMWASMLQQLRRNPRAQYNYTDVCLCRAILLKASHRDGCWDGIDVAVGWNKWSGDIFFYIIL